MWLVFLKPQMVFVMLLRKQDGKITAEFPPQTTGARQYYYNMYLCNRGGFEVQYISPQEVRISKDEAP